MRTVAKSKAYGIYRAKCLNNRDPIGLGRILVHVYSRDGGLSYSEDSHQWIPVLSPYGGLREMGLFMIPPINAEGFVQFQDGDISKPIWVGAYPFAPAKQIDDEASQAAGYAVVKVLPTVPPELGADASRVIFKTQYTTQDNPDPTSDSNKVENLVTMDNDKFELLHVNQSEYAYKPGGVSTGDPGSYLSFKDDSLTLGILGSDGRRNEIVIDTGGITLKVAGGEQVKIMDGMIQLIGTDKTQIKVVAKDNGAVVINAKTIVIDGEQIISGPPGAAGGGGAITTDCLCPFTGMPTHIGSTKTIIGG
jgi:hypothetical protein